MTTPTLIPSSLWAISIGSLRSEAFEITTATSHAIKFELTLEQITSTWAPYLTMGEGLKLAAQAFDRDVAHLSCCAV